MKGKNAKKEVKKPSSKAGKGAKPAATPAKGSKG